MLKLLVSLNQKIASIVKAAVTDTKKTFLLITETLLRLTCSSKTGIFSSSTSIDLLSAIGSGVSSLYSII